ncbi:flocculation protein FLO11 [Diaphorina citri]|uniref:Flocculation protein FLO11 n=2 Tax=Diaphorina citri TaxID=121845 RepID=A0A3Q0IVT1_DIACI|nr:flocculation protein FLO11 [Diaphorina citri]
MDSNLEKDCSAIGGLFQQIITELKNGTPMWEDLISKATKLHTCLRATIHAIAAYLDAFQKIADAATNTRGATKDIGSALTRICLRQKAVEARMKTFTSAILDCLVVPLHLKMEKGRRVNVDNRHNEKYKKARSELKKRSTDTLRLQKKVGRKGVVGRNADLQKALQEVNERKAILEEAEKKALRAALIEERSRYCVFVTFLKPVVDEEVAMLSELSHLQEVMVQLEKHTSDPYSLPPASEQVMADMKGSDTTWLLPSPTSSPGSLGSRKSSMCSISSINSSSSGSSKSHHSPSHNYWNRSIHQRPPLHGTFRLSSVSSQDSGFTSQSDFGYFTSRYNSGKTGNGNGSNGKTDCDAPDSTSPSSSNGNNVTFTESNTSASTWPNLQDTLQFERAASAILSERPHTISSAYERGGQHTPRPALSVYTFQNPAGPNVSQPVSPNTSSSSQIYARPPIPLRCSSLERPSVPTKSPGTALGKPSESTSHLIPADYLHPTYVNMYDLANMAASKAAEMKGGGQNATGESGSAPHPTTEHKTEPNEKDSSTSESSLESSSGYGSQTQNLDMENSIYNEVTASVLSLNQFVEAMNIIPESRVYQRPASTFGYPNSNSMRSSLLRRSSINTPKPPPPVRRTSSISGGSRLQSREGSLENLPPPPAFLLSENSGSSGSLAEIQKSVANSIASEIAKRNQELNSGHYHRIMCSVSSEGSPKLSRHTFNTDTSQQPIYSRSTSNNEPMYRSTSNTDTQPIYSRSSNTDSQPIYGRTNNEPIYRSTTNTDTQPIYRSTSNTDTQPIYSRSTSNTENQPIYRSTSSFTGVPEPRSQVQAPAQESKVEITGSVCVAETVRTLTELNHQPASPVAVRRSSSSRSTSADRQSIIAQLSARLTPTLTRRHYDSLPRSSRVRQWISLRTSPDPKLCHDSLMEQIKRGTALRKTRTVNDRSAPRIR